MLGNRLRRVAGPLSMYSPWLIGPMNTEFGWSFQSISAGITIYGVSWGIARPGIWRNSRTVKGVRPVAIGSMIGFHLQLHGVLLS